MRVFRIERKRYLNDTLKGIGASRAYGNRWNSHGVHLVYATATRALGMLEILVHLKLQENIPNDRLYVEIDIPNNFKILEMKLEELPEDWNKKPVSKSTQIIGDQFVREMKAPILKVPSVIIPQEFNYLINPFHPKAHKIQVISTAPFLFDERFQQ